MVHGHHSDQGAILDWGVATTLLVSGEISGRGWSTTGAQHSSQDRGRSHYYFTVASCYPDAVLLVLIALLHSILHVNALFCPIFSALRQPDRPHRSIVEAPRCQKPFQQAKYCHCY